MRTVILDPLRANLGALLDQARADGGANIPIDVLRDLLEHGPRPAPSTHEIVFPGPSHTWLMRHPADCPGADCPHASAARWQFTRPESGWTPGEFVAEFTGDAYLETHAITRIQIGHSA